MSCPLMTGSDLISLFNCGIAILQYASYLFNDFICLSCYSCAPGRVCLVPRGLVAGILGEGGRRGNEWRMWPSDLNRWS